MSKLAYFNPQDGRVLQWLDTDALQYKLPDASLLHNCSEAEWASRQDGDMMVRDGAIHPYAAPQADLAQLRASQHALIQNACNRELAMLSAAYPEREVASWPQQEREARDLADSPAVSAPLLSSIAAARGLAVADLAGRVRAKADAYAIAAGKIIGRKQALTDSLDAINLAMSDAPARIAAIAWPSANTA